MSGATVVSRFGPRYPETTEGLELRALEKKAAAICRHTTLLCREAEAAGALGTREAELQRLAFEERRSEAMRLMRNGPPEPYWTRIERLERVVDALEASRAFFKSRHDAAPE